MTTINSDVSGTTTVRMRGPVSGLLLYWLAKVMSAILAPGFHTMEGLQKAIRKNRIQGPARLPRRFLRRFDFREEERHGSLIFHVTPRKAGRRPLHFLYLHGGAFVIDLQGIQWNLAVGLLDHVDADMTVPIYPLGPEATWRETMQCCKSVYLEMAEAYGAENIVVTGDSAGGGLALLLAQALRDEGRSQPAALVLYSPVFDLSASGEDQPALERRDPGITISLIQNAHRLWAPDLQPQDSRISALFADQKGLAPTLIFSGDREVLDSDARRLKAINPAVDHWSYAEMAHVFPIGGTREGIHAYQETAAFLARNLPTT